MTTANQKPVGVARSASAVNLNPQSKDCYFYFYSHCSKGEQCAFRHCSAAMEKEDACFDWTSTGVCGRDICPYRHSFPTRQRSVIPCYWESQSTGCLKPHCPFLHSKARPKPPGAKDRVAQYKFSNIKIKSLGELKQSKDQVVTADIHIEKGRAVSVQALENSSSVGLKSFGDTVMKIDLQTEQVHAQRVNDSKAMESIAMEGPSIFSTHKSTASIFSPNYVSDPKNVNDVTITSPEKKFSFSIESESSDDSNLAMPTEDSNKCPPAADATCEVNAVRGLKRLSVEKLESVETKKPKLSRPSSPMQTKQEHTATTGMDFRIKSLNEIRAEKKKGADPVTDDVDHVTEPVSHVTDDVTKAVPETQKLAKKKIVLIRRKPVVTNGNDPVETGRIETDTAPLEGNSATAKKLKLIRPLTDNPASQPITSTAQMKQIVQLNPPSAQRSSLTANPAVKSSREKVVTVSTANRESEAIKQKRNENQSQNKPRVANRAATNGEERTNLHKQDSAIKLPAVDHSTTTSTPLRTLPLSSKGVTIDPIEASLLLSPVMEETHVLVGGKLAGGTASRKMSLAEMKAEIQSELLQRKASEDHDESLDAELEKLAGELVADDTTLLESKTDDDLMLEMEEFI